MSCLLQESLEIVTLFFAVNSSIQGVYEFLLLCVRLHNLETILAENNSANNQQIKDLQDSTEAQNAVTKAYFENNTTSSGLSPGSTVGDMLYWDGENWTQIPSPENNGTLKFCEEQLTWGARR